MNNRKAFEATATPSVYITGVPEQKGKVIGIGGVFLKSPDKKRLSAWYADQLGIAQEAYGGLFQWRSFEDPNREHLTTWSVFPAESTYFDPGGASFMINYIVDDMEAILAKLAANGVSIDPKREDHDYGRFAWVYDPDGNKIELWEPKG
jgi:catechol 2,3-dioxygenase-like lactoylglutathione lyase family enzyme